MAMAIGRCAMLASASSLYTWQVLAFVLPHAWPGTDSELGVQQGLVMAS